MAFWDKLFRPQDKFSGQIFALKTKYFGLELHIVLYMNRPLDLGDSIVKHPFFEPSDSPDLGVWIPPVLGMKPGHIIKKEQVF